MAKVQGMNHVLHVTHLHRQPHCSWILSGFNNYIKKTDFLLKEYTNLGENLKKIQLVE